MKAVIMAGGEGTRLRPITLTRPKPFVPVGGRPAIEYVLDRLKEAGVGDAIITTCYRPEALIGHLGGGSGVGMNLVYSVEDEPLGTAGGVKKVESFLDDTFLVLSGDVFADVNVKKVIEFHKSRKALATIALTEVEDPSQFGIVGLDDEGRIEKFQEKPKREEAFSNLVNAGIYVLEPEVLDLIPKDEKFDFSKQLFPLLLEKGERLFGTRLEGLWIDIGRPADLLEANAIVCERGEGNRVSPEAEVAGDVDLELSSVHAQARIDAGARLERSIVLEGARVGKGARLVNTFVGRNARVGDGARLTGCVLGDDARVSAHAKLQDEKVVGESTQNPIETSP